MEILFHYEVKQKYTRYLTQSSHCLSCVMNDRKLGSMEWSNNERYKQKTHILL